MTARAGVAPRQASAAWRLELLGGATLIGAGGARVALERKTAGLLALLAFEGELARSKAAGLLWPDVSEERARANLRQCLHRLKKALGANADTDHSLQIVLIGERLSLAAQLEVDTVTLESRAFVGDDAGLIAVRGQLLEQIDFDDCPEFAEWLTAQRSHWRDARSAAFNRALRDPAISSAVEWAHEWVALEPLSEEAQRALARAFAMRGNRALALQTLRDFAILLRVELDASPSIETSALLESLERDQPMPASVAPRVPRALPSPPRLIGRGREWALLERAWADGMDIVVRGAPGVGKSRLIADFLSSKTRFDWLEARPGDAGVPMAVYARALNSLPPGFALELPEWVVTGELHGLEIAARARLAASYRAAGQTLEALGHTTRGLALVSVFESDLYRGELLLEHYRCLLATNHPDARPFLERTLNWLTQTATQRVPPEYRQGFLQGNPINRALLVGAHAASLETPAFS